MIDDFNGKVAVVTGAASGIGYALAAKAAALGMRVALADVEREALAAADARLRDAGADTFSEVVDVAERSAMRRFADAVAARYGHVHLLCNNAGVGSNDSMLAMDLDGWEWTLGVNLFGVVYGTGLFLPGMLEHGEGGHVVNTASVAGLCSPPGAMGSYNTSKHAVVALSESLHGELRKAGDQAAGVGASVLCPSYVATNIYRSARNQPEDVEPPSPEQAGLFDGVAEFFRDHGMDPGAVAEQVFDAVRENRFYILTHPEGIKELVRRRMQGILDDGAPDMSGSEEFPI